MLKLVQENLRAWVEHNFGDRPWHQPFMGIVEEVGELSHALLKQEQGIRGSWEEHENEAKDAIGDILIYMCDLCNARGWDAEKILEDTWAHVSKRDWKANPNKGDE